MTPYGVGNVGAVEARVDGEVVGVVLVVLRLVQEICITREDPLAHKQRRPRNGVRVVVAPIVHGRV